jgi:hypothetical protein
MGQLPRSDAALETTSTGLTNLQEYLAGTDHEDPDSNLKFAQITVGTTKRRCRPRQRPSTA